MNLRIPIVKLISLNVARPRLMIYKGTTINTGIFKKPVPGRIQLRTLNLDGDRQADLSVHGGPFKAVYAYPSEHYEFWRQNCPERSCPGACSARTSRRKVCRNVSFILAIACRSAQPSSWSASHACPVTNWQQNFSETTCSRASCSAAAAAFIFQWSGKDGGSRRYVRVPAPGTAGHHDRRNEPALCRR